MPAYQPSAHTLQLLEQDELLERFTESCLSMGKRYARDFPWKRTHDPYAIWISEVMLQQTQVARVLDRWGSWMEQFPSVQALARASSSDVLRAWQGMGYKRRALALHTAAQQIADKGVFPQDLHQLLELPGIGPSTAAGIRAFAFNLPALYLETNVRSVLLHELFSEQDNVHDKDLYLVLERLCPAAGEQKLHIEGSSYTISPRIWYYALLDYGAQLKLWFPNPNRKSRHHNVQSKFEGSFRQKRAFVLRLLLDACGIEQACSAEDIQLALNEHELSKGRPPVSATVVAEVLAALYSEGFCENKDDLWFSS